MPDPAPSKRQYQPPPGDTTCDRSARHVAYAELHCKTNFSFLEGASHPDELVVRAAELGYHALAITDRNSVAGVVRAHVAAKDRRLKLLIGAEVTPDDAAAVVLWATDRPAYGRLCRLLTRGRMRAPKGGCQLHFADIAEHAAGLLAGVLLNSFETQTRDSMESASSAFRSRSDRATWPCCSATRKPRSAALADYRDLFGDRCYAIAELHHGPQDRRLLAQWVEETERNRVPLVAANDVHYHMAARQPLQDVLTAIRHGCTVAELGSRRFANAERHLKPATGLAPLFAGYPQALARTVEIADRCSFSLDELRYDYPEELCPAGLSPQHYLLQLTWSGARERYPGGIPEKVRGLIEHELRLIDELRYAPYFLTVWDLVRFARDRGILCQGRGSAANSVVCFCLGVTSVDPERIDVLFERFVSRERNEAPDIDVDFEHERREEVLQYLYGKYGRERAGMTAEVISYRPRSAIRDVGKALGLSPDRIAALAKYVDHLHDAEQLAGRLHEAGLPRDSLLGRQLASLAKELLEFPRHLSQHVGGMVITNGPLCELVPIENAAMPGRTVIAWDKNDLDALGILKVDCLSLGMLTAIRKCFQLLEHPIGRPLTLATVPAEDPAVYEMCCRGDTMGVFQIESRAQMAMLPRLRPRCFYDLVIEVAIVRPGPIQGDMVHPYLRRRAGEEPVDFPDDRVREVLVKTLGVPIFQEQAMRLAIVAAGFTPGEADQLRRAMGAWRRQGVIDQFRQKLVDGLLGNGYSAEFAERLFKQIRGFGEYGFPESHAASFALLVYASAWLKCYYPAAFAAALLNSQPMGFYAPAQLVANARQHGVEVRPVDVNHSDWDCTLEPLWPPPSWPRCSATREPGSKPVSAIGPSNLQASLPEKDFRPHFPFALRLGFRMVQGLPQAHVDRLVSERGRRPFDSWEDFAGRTGFSRAVLTRLSRADAFQSLAIGRRDALWRSLAGTDVRPLLAAAPPEHDTVPLPAMPAVEEVYADYGATGLSLRAHPVSFLRTELARRRITPADRLAHLADGQRITVAGIVLMRQRPSTASGVTFVTLEDETGFTNLIVHAHVWERHDQVARGATLLQAYGTLQRQGDVIHVIVSRLKDLSSQLRQLPVTSRDFR